MKNTIKIFGIIALAAVIVLSIASCGGGGSSSPAAGAGTGTGSAPATAGSATPASITNWDQLITEYERFFMNEYIPLINRLKAGDASVLAQIQTLQDRFLDWANKMESLAITAGEPTAAQEARLDALLDKIADAMEF